MDNFKDIEIHYLPNGQREFRLKDESNLFLFREVVTLNGIEQKKFDLRDELAEDIKEFLKNRAYKLKEMLEEFRFHINEIKGIHPEDDIEVIDDLVYHEYIKILKRTISKILNDEDLKDNLEKRYQNLKKKYGDDEDFRECKSIKGLYVSKYGKVRTKEGKETFGNSDSRDGYLTTTIRKIQVQNLVAEAFPEIVGVKTKEKKTVNHKDEIKWHNDAYNLNYVSRSENACHGEALKSKAYNLGIKIKRSDGKVYFSKSAAAKDLYESDENKKQKKYKDPESIRGALKRKFSKQKTVELLGYTFELI